MAQPLLATDTVRFVGEPVAVVVHEGRYTGEDIAELVEVDYEPLPAVVDPKVALDGSTLLFPELGSNVVLSRDPEEQAATFDDCEVVVTQEILNQRVAVAPLEVRSAAAVWIDGRLTAWIPNQGAQGTQEAAGRRARTDDRAGPRDHPGRRRRVRGEVRLRPRAGPGLLGRAAPRPARRPGSRPARRTWSAMTHGRAQIQTITIGGDRDGNVKAYRLHVLQDSGAYPRFGAVLPTLTLLMAPAVYDIDRLETTFASVVTNTTPLGAYRGAGRPEATAVIERAMDLFAAEIGMDPAEVRRRNLLPAFTEPLTTKGGALYDTGDYPMALETVLAGGRLRRLAT